MEAIKKLPVYFLPHGGGPWHVMREDFGSDPGYESLAAWLESVGKKYKGSIKSILSISAHWEAPKPTVHFGKNPGMLYDYYGFPEHTYQIKWPAPGSPELAERVQTLLNSSGFETAQETERGYDHGTFVPLMLAFPEASIPVAQLSLVFSLDPATHFKIGQALEPLREEGVLILTNGMSYHNMRGFMSNDPKVFAASQDFDNWLAQAVATPDPEERKKSLSKWLEAPSARACHPRSEHLVPLFVAAGAGGNDAGRREFAETILGVRISGYVFGE